MKNKLIHKMMAFVLPLTMASVVVTSIVLTLISYQNFRDNIDENYRHILKNAAGQVSIFMDFAKNDLDTLAQVIAALNMDAWQKGMVMSAFIQLHQGFASISMTDPDSGIETKSGVSEESAPDLALIFDKARSGQSAASRVLFNSNNLPYVYMAAPVQRQGEISEILYGQLNLKAVWNILMDIQIGRTGRISVLDADGVTIGHPLITEVISKRQIKNPDVLKKLAVAGQIVQWTEPGDHGSYLCLGIRLASPDWVIMLSQHLSESYAHLYRHIAWAVGLTLIMSLIAGILSWKNGRRFLDPIHALHRQVKNISHGDLNSKISLTTDDEVADLGRAFNEMVDSLQKHIIREVEHAKQLVHAKNLAELGTTASKVTHEVGNLLNNIGLTVMALNTESMTPRGQKALEMLKNDSERIRKFIEDFLRFAKKPELHLRPMPLNPLIREVMAAYEAQMQLANVHAEIDWPQDIPPVPVDAQRIYQVFSNLVKNSIQAMQETGGVIRISATLEEPEYLQICLADTGPGIDARIAGQIFQPFFTTKGKQGTGLGLAIVKSVIEAHRGTISCQSRPGEGAQFIIQLPLR